MFDNLMLWTKKQVINVRTRNKNKNIKNKKIIVQAYFMHIQRKNVDVVNYNLL